MAVKSYSSFAQDLGSQDPNKEALQLMHDLGFQFPQEPTSSKLPSAERQVEFFSNIAKSMARAMWQSFQPPPKKIYEERP